MKILSEAFSSSMPEFVKDFMTTDAYTSWNRSYPQRNVALNKGVDPANSEFVEMPKDANYIRKELKNGNILFARIPAGEDIEDFSVMIVYDWGNNVNKLYVEGRGKNTLKEKSLKWIVEHSTALYMTKSSSEDLSKLRRDRRKSREGGIFRDKDNIVDPNAEYVTDINNLKKDASGYLYDSARLAKKLVALNAENPARMLTKASKLFQQMVSDYTDKIKEMSTATKFDTGAFSQTGFHYILGEGERILDESSRKINAINDNIEEVAISYEDFIDEVNNSRRASNKTSLNAEEAETYYNKFRNRITRIISDAYADLRANKEQLDKILAGKGQEK